MLKKVKMEPRLLFSVISDTFPRDIVVCIRFKYLAVMIVLEIHPKQEQFQTKLFLIKK